LDELSDIFLNSVKKYLPDRQYVHAVTGGFDGRTLISSGLYHKKKFSCYSFGSSGSKDVQIASRLAFQAGIPYINIELHDKYVEKESLICGQEFVHNSSGSATFARAHYLYAAKELSGDYKYILTGNFGSEIFRAAHIAGALISSNLYALFKTENPAKGIKTIDQSMELTYLTRDLFKDQWKELKKIF